MGELKPVDGAWHFNVGKDGPNIASLFEHRNGFDPGPGLDNVKAGALDDRGGGPPQQDLVLDDEHDRAAARAMHDFPTSLRMPRVRFGTCVLARVRVTQFLCRIPDKGGAHFQIGNPALCSGKSTK